MADSSITPITPPVDPNPSPAALLQEQILLAREQARIAQEREESVRQEFASASTADEIIKVGRKAIAELLPKAVLNLEAILDNPDEPSTVRASVSKFVVAQSLDRSKLEDSEDGELRDLLKSMANKPDIEQMAKDEALVENDE